MPDRTVEDRIQMFRHMMHPWIREIDTAGLINRGFFEAPASTKHHGAYEGGLFDHSYAVTEALVNLTKDLRLEWVTDRSPYIVGMFHDLCKIDNYVPKDEGGFDYSNIMLIKGHGDKSVMLLSEYTTLSAEEIMCIRYHMGAYEKDEWDYFDRAIRKYPNVLYTHTADMIVSKIAGV